MHPGALGDVLLAVPALRALKAACPGEPLAFAGQPRISRLLAALGLVDRALAFEALRLDALLAGEADDVAAEVRSAGRLVCWFGAHDAGFVARLTALGPGAIVAPPYASGRAVWEHLLGTVGVPPAAAERFRAVVEVAPELVADGGRALARAGWDGSTPVVLVHPGAGGVAKRWPVEGFAAALERLAAAQRVAIVIHEGPADHEAAAGLAARLRAPSLRLGEPALPILAGVLAMASVYLGNDSGVSHLASAVGVACVTLFTRDKLPWRPWALGVEPLVIATSTLEPGDVERVAAALLGLVA